jgi:arylsulfatase A-like enzyme
MTTTINRREFMKRTAFSLGAFSLTGAYGARAMGQESVKPNILFVFADDMTFDAIRELGNGEAITPNLDRLVKRGVSFTNCYNQGGWHGAICVASRTMLLTGRFLWNARDTERKLEQECEDGRLWPQYLERAGYNTYMSGKWHIKCDAEKAFQNIGHVRPGMPPDVEVQYDRPKDVVPDPYDPTDPELGGHFTGGKHWSEALGDDGIGFLQDAAKQDAPFFMYLAFNAPHDPRQSPQEYLDMHPLDSISIPENYQPEHPDKEAIGCGKTLRDERLAPFPRTEEAVRVNRREYYAIISHADAQIGRILDALEATGKADNTYIFFTADNGLAVGRHGLMGKQNMYEHSMKVPLIAAGPGIPADQRIDALVYLQDIVPTTLDLAGVEKPEQVQFNSLMPLIKGEKDNGHDAIYGAYMDKQRMVRVDNHKLICYPGIDKYELYDLEKDPLEKHDLAGDSKLSIRLNAMKVRLRELQKEMGDPFVGS